MRAGHRLDRAELHYANSGPVVIEGGWCPPFHTRSAWGSRSWRRMELWKYGSREGPVSCFGRRREDAAACRTRDAFEKELSYFLECAAGGRQPLSARRLGPGGTSHDLTVEIARA